MTPTPSIFGPQAGQEIINTLLASIDTGVKNGYRMFWDALISALATHWAAVIIVLVAILIMALAVWITTGRWAMLGSVLYNYLYFGILFIIGLIWGSDVFVSDYFHAIGTIALNPICYLIVRWILNKTGIRRSI